MMLLSGVRLNVPLADTRGLGARSSWAARYARCLLCQFRESRQCLIDPARDVGNAFAIDGSSSATDVPFATSA